MTADGALVLGGDYRALGIVRSLGRRGIPVWVVVGKDRLAGYSRYASRRIELPDASDEQLAEWLVALSDRHGLDGWTLFPSAEETAWMVSRYHAMLSKAFRLTTSPCEIYSGAVDKARAYRLASDLGVGAPRTWTPLSLDELLALDVPYPVILKPTLRLESNPFTDQKAWRVEHAGELSDQYKRALTYARASEIMVQEIIPGVGENQLAFGSVCDEGHVVGWVTARRTRQYPADFGRASTFVETIHDPEVADAATQLIAALGVSGLVEVEFKRDARDGALKLLDINARAWGWHSIGAAAGVDFPYLAWRVAHGELLDTTQGVAGVRWIRMSTDIPAAFNDILHHRTTVGSYLRSVRRPLEGPIAARDDRVPALLDMPLLARRLLKRRMTTRRAAPTSQTTK
jgi:predicted ATP-grasp superfamily ATP-dependent carboligase